jgi:hypothetical protein
MSNALTALSQTSQPILLTKLSNPSFEVPTHEVNRIIRGFCCQ